MADDELFSDLPVQTKARTFDAGDPRLREPVRDQVELRVVDLDRLIGAGHPARVIWDYVQGLDLRALEQAVRAREHTPGQAPVSPRLLLALWLYATSEGIGSARALARLCESHDAYRWLCGGVSVNYHGLADFRTSDPDLLDRLCLAGEVMWGRLSPHPALETEGARRVRPTRVAPLAIFLREDADDFGLRERFFEQFARARPCDRQRTHGAGKENSVANGQDGQRVGNLRRPIFVFVGHSCVGLRRTGVGRAGFGRNRRIGIHVQEERVL